ncbi:hypothetical protein NCPPB1935_04500 [Xanthomonas campestris pv. nigromaculans]|nr:hypothetical protein NCPPB1935_04500 [Xanthomonas campestris pv. nigromaculans]
MLLECYIDGGKRVDQRLVGRGRGALAARGTRRKYVPVATVLLEGLWPLRKPGTVVPAAGSSHRPIQRMDTQAGMA